MLATFLFEIVAALYILIRYKRTKIALLIIALLVCLAIFQGAEYLLCGGFGLSGSMWSKIGYLAITMLPPLGLHLIHAIAGKKSRTVIPLAYLTASIYLIYFTFYTGVVSGTTCYANYVVFNSSSELLPPILYAIYYYGWMLVAVWLAIKFVRLSRRHNVKSALAALALGYGSFIIPTTTVNLIDPNTIAGIPSIMCGFAVILAAVLVAKVAPESIER